MSVWPCPCVACHLHPGLHLFWGDFLVPCSRFCLPSFSWHQQTAAAASLLHFSLLQVAPEGVDAMVAELNAKQAQRAAFSRRRAFRTDADVDYINSRNAHFNKKIERAFGTHTAEIKANLERGTALPD